MMPSLVAAVTVIGLGTSINTRADDSWEPSRQLHVNGYAWHIASEGDVNEFVWGLGLTWDIKRVNFGWIKLTDVVMAFDGDVLMDSNNEWSVAGGVSLRKSVGMVDLGVLAGLTYKRNLLEDTGLPLFPYVVPFIQSNIGRHHNVRAVWIPPVRKSSDNQIVFQLLLSLE